MSYDVNFVIDTGDEYPTEIGGDYLNYTYNCGPMFRLALGGNGLYDLHGKLAGDMREKLTAAVAHMEHPDNTAVYEEMNPANGWGDHRSATEFLNLVKVKAHKHPRATIMIS